MAGELETEIGRLAGQMETLTPILIRMEERQVALGTRLAALEANHQAADRQGHAVHKSINVRLQAGDVEFRQLALDVQALTNDLTAVKTWMQQQKEKSEKFRTKALADAQQRADDTNAERAAKKWDVRKSFIVAGLAMSGALLVKALEKLLHLLGIL